MRTAVVSTAAVVALAGMLVMHGIPLPGAASFHLGMTMDRPAPHAGASMMTEHASISAAGVMAGPHNCVPDIPRLLRVALAPATTSLQLDSATLAGVLGPVTPASGALARAGPSLDRLCVSRR